MTNGVGSTRGVETRGEGMSHAPGGMGQDGERFHHATQDGAPFNTCEMFTSGTFLLIFSDCG